MAGSKRSRVPIPRRGQGSAARHSRDQVFLFMALPVRGELPTRDQKLKYRKTLTLDSDSVTYRISATVSSARGSVGWKAIVFS